ncbi:hypothetical protein [Natrinema sp. DC36]|uniref:SPW repeat domain-containing protein n=1 Tax=Natrinema sp. DC36 TaxID=2878680 RepID=UPI001CEFCAE1|nr:hypothetical protein [Natrinema sp. DC36]
MSRTLSADDSLVLVERTARLAAVFGTFIMVSTVIFTITNFMGIQNVLVGAVVAFLASLQSYLVSERRFPSIIVAGLTTLLGIWIAVAPHVLGVTRELVIGINGIAGALIVVLSLTGVYGSFQTSKVSNFRPTGM